MTNERFLLLLVVVDSVLGVNSGSIPLQKSDQYHHSSAFVGRPSQEQQDYHHSVHNDENHVSPARKLNSPVIQQQQQHDREEDDDDDLFRMISLKESNIPLNAKTLYLHDYFYFIYNQVETDFFSMQEKPPPAATMLIHHETNHRKEEETTSHFATIVSWWKMLNVFIDASNQFEEKWFLPSRLALDALVFGTTFIEMASLDFDNNNDNNNLSQCNNDDDESENVSQINLEEEDKTLQQQHDRRPSCKKAKEKRKRILVTKIRKRARRTILSHMNEKDLGRDDLDDDEFDLLLEDLKFPLMVEEEYQVYETVENNKVPIQQKENASEEDDIFTEESDFDDDDRDDDDAILLTSEVPDSWSHDKEEALRFVMDQANQKNTDEEEDVLSDSDWELLEACSIDSYNDQEENTPSIDNSKSLIEKEQITIGTTPWNFFFGKLKDENMNAVVPKKRFKNNTTWNFFFVRKKSFVVLNEKEKRPPPPPPPPRDEMTLQTKQTCGPLERPPPPPPPPLFFKTKRPTGHNVQRQQEEQQQPPWVVLHQRSPPPPPPPKQVGHNPRWYRRQREGPPPPPPPLSRKR